MMQIKSTKSFYRIREVAAMLDVPAYTLRYWESEFPQLKPQRTEFGQRRYTSSDVELVKAIKTLLYEKGMTIEGVRSQLASSYRKYPSRQMPKCKDAADAIRLLNAVVDTVDGDSHATARLKSVITWLNELI